MNDFLQHTIIGAEFDSSARDPPPRCHPGTRLAIINHCLDFVVECRDKEKLRWVVGPAGAGKLAIMQMVIENVPDNVIFASVFLSINGRRDGIKTIVTIAYQLLVKCEPYRQFIRNEVEKDPSLLRKSLSVHFKRFIVKPFMNRQLFKPSDRFLIAIDGFDECDNTHTQYELLQLISDFCISFPTSPVVWIVASHPEPRIKSFFAKAEVQLMFVKEDIKIDSDEACADVERYLRDELKRIKLEYPSLRRKREWPSEHEITTIASAAGGLFAYASSVVRDIDDPHYRDPSAQLHRILRTIHAALHNDKLGRDHPMAQLDALYTRILSSVPDDVMVNTRKLLLLHLTPKRLWISFREQCNLLGLTEDVAYAAICHLQAVVRAPEPDKADDKPLQSFHKSFEDFLLDFKRSGFSHDIKDEVQRLGLQTSLRVVNDTSTDSGGTSRDGGMSCYRCGYLEVSPDLCGNISLSWPGDERFEMTDSELRLDLYRLSMAIICMEFRSDPKFYGSLSCFHVLTTRFTSLDRAFPLVRLRESAFDKFRHELALLGKLKQVPLITLNYAAICGDIELRYTGPIGMNIELSGSWNPSCKHTKVELECVQHWRGWSTHWAGRFDENANDNLDAEDGITSSVIHPFVPDPCFVAQKSHQKAFRRGRRALFDSSECDFCLERFARHFITHASQPATIFVDSTGMCYVELLFVDPDDRVSE